MKKMNKILVTIAIITTMGTSSQVMAGAEAYSYLELSNIQLFNETADRQADFNDFTNWRNRPSSQTSAGSSFGASDSYSNPSGHDASMSCSGSDSDCARIVENDPARSSAAINFGRSDTFGDGGSLITGVPDSTAPSSANIWTIAEGLQDTTGFTAGQSNTLSTTEFTFALTEETTLRLDFDADGELFTKLHQDQVQATADFNWSASIVEILPGGGAGDMVFNWAPNGKIGDGISGGTELLDGFNMNMGTGVTSKGESGTGLLAGEFSAKTTLGPSSYRFTISHKSSIVTDAVKDPTEPPKGIPEPATLALLFAGLGMLGFVRRF